MISSHYGLNNENCFKIAFSYLKEFLLWYPKLQLVLENNKKTKIETLFETLQKFKDINDNEEDIITLFTRESNSYRQDFNRWLNNLDPLAIQKTSWFIASVMYCLNRYSENKGGVKKNMTLYRGIKMNLIDLLYYEREKDKIICYPSFTSTTPKIIIAESFSKFNKLQNQYETIITINYIYKEDFISNAVDISNISVFSSEKCILFLPYSFFKIKKVEIDHINKKGSIELDSIGKKAIFEETLRDGYKLNYNEGGFMEIIECN